ncbi:MAG: hypothetical protein ACXWC9_01870 [Pseudobdellovibrionaceae bacterium]
MSTRIQFGILILVFSFQSVGAKVTLATSEPTKFDSVANNALLGTDKNSDFVGVLYREKMSGVEGAVDVYEVKGRSDLKLTKASCTEIAETVVGPFKKSSYQLVSADLKPSASTGQICQFVLRDPASKALIKEKHLLINILKLQVMAYMFRYGKVASQSQIVDELAFVESLRTGPAPLQ